MDRQHAYITLSRYYGDVTFHQLVDNLVNVCHAAEYSLDELRDAAALAEAMLVRERYLTCVDAASALQRVRPDLVAAFVQSRPLYDPAPFAPPASPAGESAAAPGAAL